MSTRNRCCANDCRSLSSVLHSDSHNGIWMFEKFKSYSFNPKILLVGLSVWYSRIWWLEWMRIFKSKSYCLFGIRNKKGFSYKRQADFYFSNAPYLVPRAWKYRLQSVWGYFRRRILFRVRFKIMRLKFKW